MKEKSTEGAAESRPVWESLEAFARQGVQRLLQQLLEEEVEQVLGRRRYERREGVDAPPGYRNGVGKPRRLFEKPYNRTNGFWPNYDVTPDGQRLLMIKGVAQEAPRHINVVLNWFEELKGKVPVK